MKIVEGEYEEKGDLSESTFSAGLIPLAYWRSILFMV